MATTPPDPQPYRRSQRRRALIGWLGGFLVIAAVVVLIVAGASDSHHRRSFKVPYGELMTAKDYAEIELGEEDAVVLTRLVETGRPERFVEPYVLVLFPPREEGDYCTYFEFSDELSIFARLCFDESSGELTQKLRHDVHHPLRGLGGGQGQTV
jgi:hypothetical protein